MAKKFPGATPDPTAPPVIDPMQAAQAAYTSAAQGGQKGDQAPDWTRWFQMQQDANGGVQPVIGGGGKGSPDLADLTTDPGVTPSLVGLQAAALKKPWSLG